jgi:hypothetical protein
MGITRGPNIVTDGLVFMADAANPSSYPGSGTAWNDLTTNENHGTLTNGPTFNSGNSGYIDFDGTNDIAIFGSSNLLTGDNCQAATLCSWVKWTSTGRSYIASIKRSASDSTLMSISVNQTTGGTESTGYAAIVTRNAANSAHIYTSYDGDYDDGVWHNVVGRVSGVNVTIYVDGIARAESTDGMQSVTGNTATFTIGGFSLSDSIFQLNGDVAQVSFYRRAISDSEILQNYNALKGRFGL